MKEKILKLSQELIQSFGVNGFSYSDLSKSLKIKTSSIHYHFPKKTDLIIAILEKNIQDQKKGFLEIKNSEKFSSKLNAFLELILSNTCNFEFKVCIGGMIASDIDSLNTQLRKKTIEFFDQLEKIIEELIEIDTKKSDKKKLSKLLIAQIEGGLILSHLYKDKEYINNIKNNIIEIFEGIKKGE